MRRILATLAVTAAFLLPASANAQLAPGAKAPNFVAKGALGGRVFTVSLANALTRGPVVLYFYPKAFTQGCTLEANAFAQASAEFRKAGATIIGMSNDDLPTLQRFSVEACRDKFAVASATPAIIAAYDVDMVMGGKSTGYTKRTSYVIGRDGRVRMVHSDMDYKDHVRLTLDAVKALAAKSRG